MDTEYTPLHDLAMTRTILLRFGSYINEIEEGGKRKLGVLHRDRPAPDRRVKSLGLSSLEREDI